MGVNMGDHNMNNINIKVMFNQTASGCNMM